MSQQQFDIVIVGGGLVGLSLAAALKDAEWSILVVDAQPRQRPFERTPKSREGATLHSGFEARVSAINPASREFLGAIGGWPAEAQVCAFDHMRVADARGAGMISFDAGDIDEPALGYIVENRSMLRSLVETLEGSKVEIRDECAITEIDRGGHGWFVGLEDGGRIETQLLVGADGGNSVVRKACGLRAIGWNYPQQAIVTTIETGQPHQHTARQWFTAEGPLAFLPLADESERLSSIVWSSTRAERLAALPDDEFCERITAASERTLGEVLGTDRRFTFQLRQQQIFQYVTAHLVLLGDAAHTIHPLAGQGANLGLADARCLYQVLMDTRYTGAEYHALSTLRQYQRKRQPMNLLVGAAMEAFMRLYQFDGPALNWLRNAGTRAVDRQRPLKNMLARVASGR